MSETLLTIEDLRVQYGRFVAVDGLSFEMRGGDLLGMIGPNGAGKTTTLRAACGLQPITAGSVRVMGYDVFKHPTEVGQHLGFTPDEPAAYETLTVTEFLDFIGDCYGLPPSACAERIDHWLAALWLTEKRASKVRSLSRGMRQRLAVARTLLPDPHVVLMDEPAAGLDPGGRVQFRQLLASLRDQGKAVVVSSHILADLAEYCTHVLIMERGRAIRYGTVDQVAGAASHEHCRYRLVLAHTTGDVANRLESLDEGLQFAVAGDVITLEYERERAAAADLLARMITAGIPVAEFRPLEPDLEEAYLRSGIGQVD
ncbi:MAG: ABC transporter ATP-binding protein [Phycisphaerae bacterium]|nr:ABC transporter ATP-binding protein [Phycisphaerae bacterium]